VKTFTVYRVQFLNGGIGKKGAPLISAGQNVNCGYGCITMVVMSRLLSVR